MNTRQICAGCGARLVYKILMVTNSYWFMGVRTGRIRPGESQKIKHDKK